MTQSIDSSELWKTKTNNNGNSYFIRNVCRLCANISDNVLPIFDKTNEKASIHMKLKKCLPSVVILESDLKPKQICLPCVSKLNACCSFVEMSRDADSKFEAVLQNKVIPQIHIFNDSLLNNKSMPSHQDLSWLQMKQALEWPELKYDVQPCRTEPKLSNSSVSGLLNQFYQQKAFQQQIAMPNRSLSSQQNNPQENSTVLTNKEDANHSTLPSLVMQEEISSQDIIVLLELKCKDLMTVNNAPTINRKPDLPQDAMVSAIKIEPFDSNFQTKIMDTNGNIRVINLSDFDEKLIQSEKVTSPFITDGTPVEKTTNSVATSTESIHKSLETDLLSALKLDSFMGLDTGPQSSVPSKLAPKSSLVPGPLLSPVADLIANPAVEHSRGATHQSRDFRCTLCGKQFTRRNRLNAHLARHSSERPHSCDKCDQRFITRWDLTLHLRIHSGVFSCEFCGKAFPAKGKLDRHRRTHTGERPFPCTLCNKAFSEKRNLRNHLKTHAASDAKKNSNTSRNYLNFWPTTSANGSEFGNTTNDSCDKNDSILDPCGVTSKQMSVALNSAVKRDLLIDQARTNNDSKNNTSSMMSNDVTTFLKT